MTFKEKLQEKPFSAKWKESYQHLKEVAQKIKDTPVVNSEKVQALKEKIQKGEYPLKTSSEALERALRIAESIKEIEKNLVKK